MAVFVSLSPAPLILLRQRLINHGFPISLAPKSRKLKGEPTVGDFKSLKKIIDEPKRQIGEERNAYVRVYFLTVLKGLEHRLADDDDTQSDSGSRHNTIGMMMTHRATRTIRHFCINIVDIFASIVLLTV